MKKAKRKDIRPEYKPSDLGRGVRGKYLKSYAAGTNVVLLSPDVADVFKDDESVNDALRSLIKTAKQAVSSTKRPGSRSKKRHAA